VDILKALYLGVRVSIRKPVTKNLNDIKRSSNFRRHYSIDSEKCIACGICMKICPCHAIKIINSKEYEFDKHRCAYCGLCQKACPKQAIEFNNIKKD